MKFTGTFRAPRLNLQKYRTLLHEHLSGEIAHAAFVWLSAVLEEIPVWSGASHATFLRLAREAGYNLTINPGVVSRIPYGQRNGDGEIHADPQKGLYTFTYSTSLRHLIYNEFHDANVVPDSGLFSRLINPGPYMFQLKGQMAFREHAKGARLPSPERAIKVNKLRV